MTGRVGEAFDFGTLTFLQVTRLQSSYAALSRLKASSSLVFQSFSQPRALLHEFSPVQRSWLVQSA